MFIKSTYRFTRIIKETTLSRNKHFVMIWKRAIWNYENTADDAWREHQQLCLPSLIVHFFVCRLRRIDESQHSVTCIMGTMIIIIITFLSRWLFHKRANEHHPKSCFWCFILCKGKKAWDFNEVKSENEWVSEWERNPRRKNGKTKLFRSLKVFHLKQFLSSFQKPSPHNRKLRRNFIKVFN